MEMAKPVKKITEKHKLFLSLCARGVSLCDSYKEAFLTNWRNITDKLASQRGYQMKKMLESSEDYREILKMFNPPSELSQGIADLRKHPNPDIQLRATTLATKCLGWYEETQGVNLGFQVLITGRQPGEIPQGQEPIKIEGPKRPTSLLK